MAPISESKISQYSRFGQRAVYGLALLDIAKKISSVYAISADLGNSSGLDRFAKSLPQQFCNIGIAEQHMVGFAAGLASTGYNCFISSFAPFLTMRSCEQVRLNLGYMKANVKIVSIGSGVSMGYLGNSHFGLEDISIIRSIPNIPILCPADTTQVYECVDYLSTYNGAAYLRLSGTATSPLIYRSPTNCIISDSHTIREGKDLLVLSYGSILSNCASAIDQITSDTHHSVHLENVYGLHPLPKKLEILLSRFATVLVVEEHRQTGGLSSALARYIQKKSINIQLKTATLPDAFLTSGDYEYLLNRYDLSTPKLYDHFLSLITT